MKRIRVLRSLGQGLPQFAEGQIVEAEDGVCDQLVESGLAALICAIPPKPLEMVPPASQIECTVEHATEKLKAYRSRQLKQSHKESK